MYIIKNDNFSELGAQATESQIISYIKSNGSSIHIDDDYQTPMTYTSISSGSFTIGGNSSVWYTGSANPSVTVNGGSFNGRNPTACVICPYNITPSFKSLPNTGTILHLHQNLSSISPVSGYRVYTMYCHKIMPTIQPAIVDNSKTHIFINLEMYK